MPVNGHSVPYVDKATKINMSWTNPGTATLLLLSPLLEGGAPPSWLTELCSPFMRLSLPPSASHQHALKVRFVSQPTTTPEPVGTASPQQVLQTMISHLLCLSGLSSHPYGLRQSCLSF